MQDLSYIIGALLSIASSIVMLITGHPLFLVISVLVGAVTAFSWLFSCAGSKWHFIAGATALALILVQVTLLLCFTAAASITVDYYHEIYTVTAPFGVIWIAQEGSMSGSLFFAKGSLDSELTETYIAKYVEDEQLKTITTNKPIIIDGQFTLQEIKTNNYFENSLWGWRSTGEEVTEWVIHIPSLPSVNQTTGDYIYVP